MVLISLAILFAAIGALSLTGSDDGSEATAAESTSEATETSAASTPPQGSAAASPTTTRAAATSVDPANIDVRVLNNSNVSGLAADTASTLTAEGWTVAETGNYNETQIPTTTVYYGRASGAQAAAGEIAEQLGATAEAALPGLAGFGDGVIVVVTE